mgnify:CR=1 FL=1
MLDKMKTFQDLVQESLQTISEIDIFQLKEKIDHNKDINNKENEKLLFNLIIDMSCTKRLNTKIPRIKFTIISQYFSISNFKLILISSPI